METFELFNQIIEKKGYKKYLEIGIDDPDVTFNRVDAETKFGVDPYKSDEAPIMRTEEDIETFRLTIQGDLFEMTSDEFFSKRRDKFDLIFIDGLHIEQQVDRDIENSLKHLKKEGVIVVHDSLPHNLAEASPARVPGSAWCGTVWRSIWKLRQHRDDLDIFTWDFNVGATFIRPGKNIKYKDKNFPDLHVSYEYFNLYRNQLMNVKPLDWILENV